MFCTWQPTAPTVVFLTVSEDGITSTTTQTDTSGGGINAYGIRMVYQTSDLSSTSFRSTSGVQTSSVVDATSSPSPAATSPIANHTGEGGLSSGAKIATGVVVPVVVLSAAVLGAFLWRKRAKRNKTAPDQATYGHHNDKPATYSHEIGGTPLNELGVDKAPVELLAHPRDKSWNDSVELSIDR